MSVISVAIKRTIRNFQGSGTKEQELIVEVLNYLLTQIDLVENYNAELEEKIHSACLQDSSDQG